MKACSLPSGSAVHHEWQPDMCKDVSSPKGCPRGHLFPEWLRHAEQAAAQGASAAKMMPNSWPRWHACGTSVASALARGVRDILLQFSCDGVIRPHR